MKRFIIAAVAAVVLASTPAAAQTTVGLEALADVTGRAYSIGGWAKVRMVVLSVDLGCLKHQMEENGADATHRDRLQVVGLGAQFGPVVVSGHVGQAVRSHTDYVYGGSVRLPAISGPLCATSARTGSPWHGMPNPVRAGRHCVRPRCLRPAR